MSKRHVVIAIPAYTGTVHIGTMTCLLAELLTISRLGAGITLIDDIGSADIAGSRAVIIAKFLGIPTATDLVFVDHDVFWETGALRKLLSYEVDVVAGVYPRRHDPLDFPVTFLGDGPMQTAPNGLLEVAGVPAGFLRVTRAAAEKMTAAYPQLEFITRPDPDGSEGTPGGVACGMFDHYWIVGTGERLMDDYAFCRRWREIGGQIWADPEIVMNHIGPKAFTGSLGNWLRGRHTQEVEQ